MPDKSERIEKIVTKLSNGSYRQYGHELRCECPKSNDPERHPTKDSTPSFFVNVYTGQFQCFACEYSGGYKQLLKLVGESSYPEVDEIENILEDYRSKGKKEKKVIKEIEIPDNLIPAWTTGRGQDIVVSEYLKSRNIPAWILKELSIGISKNYGLLSGAIIYPIDYGEYSFWGARIINPDYTDTNTYFYPKDSPKERVLYEFDWYDDFDSVILVEGWFDYLRLRIYGYINVIPLFGKTLSIDYQVHDLLTKNIRKVYIFLDTDAIEDALKIGNKIVRFFDVFIPVISSKDPDLATEKEIDGALETAKSYYDFI